mgnify:FL=1
MGEVAGDESEPRAEDFGGALLDEPAAGEDSDDAGRDEEDGEEDGGEEDGGEEARGGEDGGDDGVGERRDP